MVDELDKALRNGNPGTHVRRWGVINSTTGEYEIRVTCRRCGEADSFKTQSQANSFKNKHQGANNVCPYEKEVKY